MKQLKSFESLDLCEPWRLLNRRISIILFLYINISTETILYELIECFSHISFKQSQRPLTVAMRPFLPQQVRVEYIIKIFLILFENRFSSLLQGPDEWGHLTALVDFAFAMREALDELNKHSFNNFKLRIGK